MSIKALGTNILIQLDKKEEEVKKSGIIVPTDSVEDKKYASVVSVGQLVMEIKVGDVVMFNPFSGTPIKDNGIEYLFISEDDILAIVTEE
jgi:chaperonin GroES